MGTEYLVRPLARVEDEEDANDFEPEENGDGEDFDEEDEDNDEDGAGGKVDNTTAFQFVESITAASGDSIISSIPRTMQQTSPQNMCTKSKNYIPDATNCCYWNSLEKIEEISYALNGAHSKKFHGST
ncbi:hypothetical protein TEA_021860 [Camellia sinensis var. sinensis]|uniref:Uncharacterized protein n=1 Tax=Camellia sinensis var. sinensis TaxID=542762 RepID=A0A4S4EET9_CAMSN|nr:hypothetical protein TEA_021860 [Camellia sinensis var. sinensis]